MKTDSDEISQFHIIRMLANGVSTVIYEAADQKRERKVALKVLNDECKNDRLQQQKIIHEAYLQSRIRDPHVVQVYDLIDWENSPCMVMEYVEGANLWQAYHQKPEFSDSAKQSIALQLISGVRSIHAMDIVHCDLKPLNLLLSSDGNLKIIDFGEAFALESTQDSGWQKPEVVWVSPLYMSPEQCRGEQPAKATDIYSVGIILYQLYTGQLPFYSEDPEEMLDFHCNQMPQPPHEIADLPADIDLIIQKCIRKNPQERYQDAGELFIALTRAYHQ